VVAKRRAVPAPSPAEIERIDRTNPRGIGWCVRELNRILARTLQNRLEAYGLTVGQYHVLQELWSEDGLTQRELSARLDVAEPWTVTSVTAMEEAGVVIRVRKSADRRFAYVHLTPRGRRLKYALVPHALAVNEIASAGFDEAEVERIKRALNAMRENVERHEGAQRAVTGRTRTRARPA
jgi:DNA-binding MarR family transcriptional regulator